MKPGFFFCLVFSSFCFGFLAEALLKRPRPLPPSLGMSAAIPSSWRLISPSSYALLPEKLVSTVASRSLSREISMRERPLDLPFLSCSLRLANRPSHSKSFNSFFKESTSSLRASHSLCLLESNLVVSMASTDDLRLVSSCLVFSSEVCMAASRAPRRSDKSFFVLSAMSTFSSSFFKVAISVFMASHNFSSLVSISLRSIASTVVFKVTRSSRCLPSLVSSSSSMVRLMVSRSLTAFSFSFKSALTRVASVFNSANSAVVHAEDSASASLETIPVTSEFPRPSLMADSSSCFNSFNSALILDWPSMAATVASHSSIFANRVEISSGLFLPMLESASLSRDF
mmetsp:Transcript_19808/g.54582  ORF Transcript_19808/g.54582 Transcript_19808/m.54582 type:complete len:342 (+) Transcript_19808:440-1465(+)